MRKRYEIGPVICLPPCGADVEVHQFLEHHFLDFTARRQQLTAKEVLTEVYKTFGKYRADQVEIWLN